jgi:hypothetical protein
LYFLKAQTLLLESITDFVRFISYISITGQVVAQLVEALCYKLEVRLFDSH